MTYVDAHIHLADPGYQGKVDWILQDAAQNGISRLLSNGVDYETSLQTVSIAKQHANLVLAAVGLHPWNVVNKGISDLSKFDALLEENRAYVSAIGEIGLDGKYTQDQKKLELQRQVFRFFLQVAEKKHLPVIIHSRLALEEVMNELSRFSPPRVLLHWYDGPTDTLRLIQDRGYMISIGPSLLSSKRIANIVKAADVGIILTETDGPVRYHGPFEGQMTRPSFVIDVVRKLAEMKNLEHNAAREAIMTNFHRLVMRT